jgi:hypothetical protein
MARYFGRNLTADDGHPPTPSVAALRGLQPLIRQRAESAIAAQDRVPTQSRRILMRAGVNGDDAWLVPNTDPDQIGGTQPYPSANVARAVTIGKFDMTPGTIPMAQCLHVPGGPTSRAVVLDWTHGGNQAIVQFVTTWTDADGGTESRTYVLPLDGSQLPNGSENTNASGMQKSLRLAEMRLPPPVDLAQLSERNRWSRPYSVEIQVNYVGSPRVVDLTVSETPINVAMEADDADDEWTQHVYGGNVHPAYPSDEREDTSGVDADQRLGTLQVLRVAQNQRRRLGPQLFHWSAHTEGGGAVTDTDLPFVTIGTAASNRWCNLLNTDQFATQGSPATFEASEPGWSMGCGGYARSWLHNNPHVMGAADRTASVGVLLRVYCQNNDTAAIAMRLHTAHDDAVASSVNNVAAHSWIDLSIAGSAALGWYEGWGVVQVGVNPEDHVIGQLLVQQATSGTDLDVYAVEAYVWDGSFAPV